MLSFEGLGWIGMILLVALSKYHKVNGTSTFTLYRSDIIILILTNCWVVACLIWILSRSNNTFRYGVIGILVAVRLSSNYPNTAIPESAPNWIQYVWNHSPTPWLITAEFMQYLCLGIEDVFHSSFDLLS